MVPEKGNVDTGKVNNMRKKKVAWASFALSTREM